MAELYRWCPSCGEEELVDEREPKTVYFGTDGYGQIVKYSQCDCGKVYGWLNIDFYRRNEGFEFDEGFKHYLKNRIKFYYRE